MTSPSPRVGAHVPASGGLARRGLPYLRDVAAEVVQVFVSNPRGWALAAGDPAQDAGFRSWCEDTGVPVFVHAPYLVNVASPDPRTLDRSVGALAHSLTRAAALGARGVVVHTGSAVHVDRRGAALRQVARTLLPLLDDLPPDAPDLLLEPTATRGGALCRTVDELGPYLDALERHPRTALCLDTCHLFAAGHDLRSRQDVDGVLTALAEVGGVERLRLVHANDSKDPLGSGRDRHERLGAGRLGVEAFAALLTHPLLAQVPFVVETPGGRDGHRADVALLSGLRAG